MEIILKPIDKGPAIVIVERALNLLRDNPDGQTFSCILEEDGTLKLVVPLTEEQHSKLFMLPVSDGKPNQVKVSKAPVKRKKKDSVRRNRLLEKIRNASSLNEAVNMITEEFMLDPEKTSSFTKAFKLTLEAIHQGKDRVNYNQIPYKDELGKLFAELFPSKGKKYFNSAMWTMAEAYIVGHPENVQGGNVALPPNG